jgi:hypothetical protein
VLMILLYLLNHYGGCHLAPPVYPKGSQRKWERQLGHQQAGNLLGRVPWLWYLQGIHPVFPAPSWSSYAWPRVHLSQTDRGQPCWGPEHAIQPDCAPSFQPCPSLWVCLVAVERQWPQSFSMTWLQDTDSKAALRPCWD